MAVAVDMQNTGDPGVRTEVVAVIEHLLADRPGVWRVSIVGSRANDPVGNENYGAETGLNAPTRWREEPASTGQR